MPAVHSVPRALAGVALLLAVLKFLSVKRQLEEKKHAFVLGRTGPLAVWRRAVTDFLVRLVVGSQEVAAALLQPRLAKAVLDSYLRNDAVTRNIAYGPRPRNHLDVYGPFGEKRGRGGGGDGDGGARAGGAAAAAGRHATQVKGAPVLVFIHGGAWSWGQKYHYAALARAFAEEGLLVVVANYSTYPSGTVDEMCDDVRRAVLWAHSHAARFGGDPDNLHIGGHSAGAHLCALLVMREAVKCLHDHDADTHGHVTHAEVRSSRTALRGKGEAEGEAEAEAKAGAGAECAGKGPVAGAGGEAGGGAEEGAVGGAASSADAAAAGGLAAATGGSGAGARAGAGASPSLSVSLLLRVVRGVIGLSGVYDIDDHYAHEASRSLFGGLLNGVATISPMAPAMACDHADFSRQSPTAVFAALLADADGVRDILPPMTLVHGTDDIVVPASSSRKLRDAMAGAGMAVELREYEGAGHADLILDPMTRTGLFRRIAADLRDHYSRAESHHAERAERRRQGTVRADATGDTADGATAALAMGPAEPAEPGAVASALAVADTPSKDGGAGALAAALCADCAARRAAAGPLSPSPPRLRPPRTRHARVRSDDDDDDDDEDDAKKEDSSASSASSGDRGRGRSRGHGHGRGVAAMGEGIYSEGDDASDRGSDAASGEGVLEGEGGDERPDPCVAVCRRRRLEFVDLPHDADADAEAEVEAAAEGEADAGVKRDGDGMRAGGTLPLLASRAPRVPRAAVALGNDLFASGEVLLPPLARKQPESTTENCCFVFVCRRAAPRSLVLTVRHQAAGGVDDAVAAGEIGSDSRGDREGEGDGVVFGATAAALTASAPSPSAAPTKIKASVDGARSTFLSAGDHFCVATNCTYTLTNASPTTAAEVVFVVIKGVA